MLRAAVDEQYVGSCGKLPVPIQIVREPARDDLTHGGVIIRRFGAADAKLPVIPLEGLAVHMHRHGSDDIRAPGIGDIVGLDPVRKFREPESVLKPGERFAPALLGGCRAQNLLAGVHRRLFRKAGAVAPLRYLQIHAPPGHVRQPALDVLFVLRLERQENRFRPARTVYIILSQQGGQRLPVRFGRVVDERYVFAGEVAVRIVQHGKAALCAAYKADGVRIGAGGGDDALAVFQRGHSAHAVTQAGGFLKPEILGCGVHLGLDAPDKLRAAAFENIHSLADRAPVLFSARLAAAPAAACAHLVLKAGAILADVAREHAAAIRQSERFAERIDDAHRLPASAVGAEVFCPVRVRAVGKRKARIRLPPVETQERISLVILEKDVIARLVALDEGVFQHERFKFRLGDDNVEIVHVRDHRRDLRQMLAAEIARHAVFQRLGLADVNHLAGSVQHDINARQQRQAVGFLAQLLNSGHGILRNVSKYKSKGVLKTRP